MTARKPAGTAIRTYEIATDHQGTFQIDVPETFRVTFAPVYMGGEGKYGGGGQRDMALRFYENENKQRAIFVGVKSFRDMSLPLRKKIKLVESESKSKSGPKGSQSSEIVEIEEQWEEVK